jgi:hypothetical protein
MHSNMPWEAHCQENRGINAETNHTPKYILLNLESTRISGAYVLIILGHFQKCLTDSEINKSFISLPELSISIHKTFLNL